MTSNTHILDTLRSENRQLLQRVFELEQEVSTQRAQLERTQRILDTVPNVLYIYDVVEQRNVYVNRAVGSTLGYTVAEIQNIETPLIAQIVHPDDYHKVVDNIGRLNGMQPGDVCEIEFRVHHSTGEWRWMLARETVFESNTDGTLRQCLGALQDITERKCIEEALRQSEETFSMMLRHMPVMLNAFDEEGTILFWNSECERVTGYTAEEVVNNPGIIELLCPDPAYREHMIDQWERMGHNYRDWEWNILCRFGEEKTIAWSNISKQFPVAAWAAWGTGIDITERKRLEEALQEANADLVRRVGEQTAELRLFQSLVEHTPDSVVVATLDGIITYANSSCKALFGYGDATVGMTIAAMRAPDEDAAEQTTLEAIIQQVMEHDIWQGMSTYQRADGSRFTAQISALLIHSPTNAPYAIAAIIRDMTEYVQHEETLRASEERLRNVVKHMPIMLDAFDEHGAIIVWNEECELVTGYSAEEMIGKPNALELLYPDKQKRALHNEQERNQRGKNFRNWEIDLVARDGTIKTIAWFNVSDRFPIPGWASWALGVEVTARHQAEQALRESEAHYRIISELISDIAYALRLEPDGTLVNEWFTDASERITGFMADEMQFGSDLMKIVYPDDQETVRESVARILTGQPDIQEFRIIAKSGETRWLRNYIQPVWDTEQERVVAIYGAAQDITERKQAEEVLCVQRDLAIKMSSVSTLEEALNQLLETVLQIEGFDCGRVYLVDHQSGDLDLVVHRGLPSQSVAHTAHDDDDSAKAHLAMEGEPLPSLVGEMCDSEGMRKVVVTPITHEGEVVAVLNLASHTHDEIPSIARSALEAIAAQVGAAIARLEAEAALRESESLLQGFLDYSPLGTLVKDVEGRILLANEYAISLLGRSREQVIGKTEQMLFTPDIAEIGRAHDQTVMQTGKPFEREEIAWVDGKPHTFHTIRFPLYDVNGAIFAIGSIATDITERKQAEEALRSSEERYRLMADNATDMISRHTPDGTYLYASPACRVLLGYDPEELIGRPGYDFFHPDDLPPMPISPVTMTNFPTVYTVSYRIRRKDSHYIWFETTSKLIRPPESDEVIEIVAVSRDITERKQAEAELQKARRAAEASTRAKSEFLANTSHEIRTPMNAVIGMTNLLLDTSLTAEQQDYVETIRISGNTLLTIINDILDFSKIEAGKMELEYHPFNVRTCIEEALDLISSKAAEKHLDLVCNIDNTTPLMLVGDMTRVRQILVNVLNNAVKFTEVGEVVVSVSACRYVGAVETDELALNDSRHELHIIVRDTGIGIPADRLDRLFQSFSQTDSSMTRRYGGTGLGLAISKRLATMMGGTMWAESEVGKGSTFHITLVVERVEPDLERSMVPSQTTMQAGQAAPIHSPMAGKRVLLVDDNPTNRLVLCRQLQLWGILPYAAASGPEALAWLRRGEQFDAAILDLHMPGMDGLMLAQEIRRLGKYVKIKHGFSLQTLPLVLLTTAETGSNAIIDPGVTFAACLTKPVKQALLYEGLLSLFTEQPRPVRPQPQEPKMDAQMAQQHPLRILIAEDNRLNQKVIVRLLQRMGYQADVAVNGIETLEALKHQAYDVVLMDVQMPEMDGWETTRHIRTLFPTEHQPRIIAMTAHALREDREQCMAMGMDDYISKPIHVEELQKSLKRVSRRMADTAE